MSRAIMTSLAVGIGGSLTVLNAIAWLTPTQDIVLPSVVFALAPIGFGVWGSPFAQRRGDSPPQALRLACLYAGARSFVFLALLALSAQI